MRGKSIYTDEALVSASVHQREWLFAGVCSASITAHVYLKETQPNSCKQAEERNMLVIGAAQ